MKTGGFHLTIQIVTSTLDSDYEFICHIVLALMRYKIH